MASKTLLCLDKTGFRRKPTKNQTAKISARIASNQIELDLQDENDLDAFIEKITTKGHSFTPAIYSKGKNGRYTRSNNSWAGQQLFVLDIDNDPDDTEYYSLEAFLDLSRKRWGLEPWLCYHSFSSTSERERFRVIYMFDHFTDEPHIRDLVHESFKRIFPFADNCHDPARLFFGSDQGVGYYNPQARTNAVEVFIKARQAIYDKDVAANGKVNNYDRDLRRFLKSINLLTIDHVPAEDYMPGISWSGNNHRFRVKNVSLLNRLKCCSKGRLTPCRKIEVPKLEGDPGKRYRYIYHYPRSSSKMEGSNHATALKARIEGGYTRQPGVKKVKIINPATAPSVTIHSSRFASMNSSSERVAPNTGNLVYLRPPPEPPHATALTILRFYRPTIELTFQETPVKRSPLKTSVEQKGLVEKDQVSTSSDPYLREFDFDKAESHCALLYRFLNGKTWLYHNELFGLLTNMAQLKGGKSRFFEALNLVPEYQIHNKVNEMTFAHTWINKHRLRPTTCARYCPFYNECNPERPTLWQLDYSKHVHKVIEEQDTIPWLVGHNNLSNAIVHWLKHKSPTSPKTGSVTCIKADTGIGKTHLIRDLVVPGGLIIAVPTHSLIHEYKDKTNNPNLLIIPEEPVHELSRDKQEELESARKRGLLDKVSSIWKQASKINGTIKHYLDSITEAKTSGDKTVIMTHERYLLSGDEYPQQTVIIDEDITRTAISNYSVSYHDFTATLSLLQASGFDTSLLGRFLDSTEDIVYPTPPMTNQELNKLRRIINAHPEIQINLFDLVQSTYFMRWRQWSNKTERPVDIHYVKRRNVPTKGKKVLLLSATITEEVVRSLFRYHHDVEFQDIGRIKHKGTVIQFTNAGSFSRSYLSKNSDMRTKLKGYLEPINTITFKDYKFRESDLHYYALSGIDSLGGKPVAVVGTPNENYASLILLATSLGWCDPGVKCEQTPTWVKGIYNGILTTLYTYTHEGLRKAHKYVVESSLTQAIGRARAIREESAVVFVFSNWPLAGVQRENLPSTLKGENKECKTILDDYPAFFCGVLSQEVTKPKQIFEIALADLRSLDHLRNQDNGEFKTARVFFIRGKAPEGVANTA